MTISNTPIASTDFSRFFHDYIKHTHRFNGLQQDFPWLYQTHPSSWLTSAGFTMTMSSTHLFDGRQQVFPWLCQVPTSSDDRGHIIHPVNTDDIIVDICKNKLKLDISTNDISRSHFIGKVRNWKSQVIVRFLSYRCREKVYNSKRNLKNDADRIFITENLTKTRTNLVKSLADLKYNQNIKTCWITDGRVYAKLNESSRRTLIRNHDIRNLLNASDYDIN